MKKIFAILLAVMLVAALAVPALATDADTGTITVNSPAAGQTYKAWLIFPATVSADGKSIAYTYEGTLSANDYFTQDEAGNVSATPAAKDAEGNLTAGAIAFLKTLATGTPLEAVSSSNPAVATFSNVAYGYYYIESTVGTVVTVDSTMPNATVNDKNTLPEVTKEADAATASLGQKLTYTVTIDAKAGAESYILHDTMSEGLTFNNDVAVKLGDAVVDAANYTVKTENIGAETFQVVFTETFCDKLDGTADIVVTYSAYVNAAALEKSEVENEALLTYGNESSIETQPKTSKTYTYDFTFNKVDGSSQAALDGAVFSLYTDKDGEAVSLVKTEDGAYRMPNNGETDDTVTEITTKGGACTVSGLSNGTYYLKELTPPAGYNAPEDPFTAVVINNANVDTGITIVNNAGTVLPSTGGIGTTIFYVIGGLLVVGAAVLLITRKRANGEG